MNITVKVGVEHAIVVADALCVRLAMSTSDEERRILENTVDSIIGELEVEECKYDCNSKEATEIRICMNHVRTIRDVILMEQGDSERDHLKQGIELSLRILAGNYIRYLPKEKRKYCYLSTAILVDKENPNKINLSYNNDYWEKGMDEYCISGFDGVYKQDLIDGRN